MFIPRKFTFNNKNEGQQYVGHVTIDKNTMEFRLLALWIGEDGLPVGVIYNREDVVKAISENVWVNIESLTDLEIDFSKDFLDQVELTN